ncbi:DUF4394 domain-containing protein [Streptomyces sp. CA-256286]|uniref:DUF4394 domain-containing protein n=1 Tax=Streptomyces sp. CA-256286 TaxID=2801033 RepID=UPI001A99DF05|nr:DUF4394 domain-containing protein [Streptomyces sp. CA-256286]QTA36783.1 hypothetical protein JHY03_69990 [Streptomyces sp. CA-256286]
MRKAVLVAALTAAVSMVVPASAGAWAAGSMPAQAVQGGPGPGDQREQKAGDDGLAVIGLTSGQRLVEFRTGAPSKSWQLGKVSGLKKDTKLVGIDFRVQNAKLYGVGDKGGIYTLNTRNAKAAKVSQLTVGLVGTFFGVDFNPAANRLRVISDTGQNLRHNIDDPAAPRTTTVDGPLTNPTMPPSSAKGVTGAAYTNNDLDADTATSLFDIDTTNDRVSLQSPANSGTLAPTGNLGVNAGPNAGFDIYFSHRARTNHGFAALSVNGAYRFYEVNVLTGQAESIGAFPRNHQVTDVALPLNQS